MMFSPSPKFRGRLQMHTGEIRKIVMIAAAAIALSAKAAEGAGVDASRNHIVCNVRDSEGAYMQDFQAIAGHIRAGDDSGVSSGWRVDRMGEFDRVDIGRRIPGDIGRDAVELVKAVRGRQALRRAPKVPLAEYRGRVAEPVEHVAHREGVR